MEPRYRWEIAQGVLWIVSTFIICIAVYNFLTNF